MVKTMPGCVLIKIDVKCPILVVQSAVSYAAFPSSLYYGIKEGVFNGFLKCDLTQNLTFNSKLKLAPPQMSSSS